MPVRYRCRHCETEIGRLPFDAEETIRKLHQFEIGEIDDYIEKMRVAKQSFIRSASIAKIRSANFPITMR